MQLFLAAAALSLHKNPQCNQWPGHHAFLTNCPSNAWVDAMVEADPAPGKVFVDIGCNKGQDAVRWVDRWGGTVKTEAWTSSLKAARPGLHFSCGTEPAGPRLVRSAAPAAGAAPKAVCVEPMPANVELLRGAARALAVPPTAVRIVQAAMVESAGANETVAFPRGGPGVEHLGMGRPFGSGSVQVNARTVDQLTAGLALGKVDVLTVDTEGADPLVLRGAQATLASVRYLEFEVARHLEPGTSWAQTQLRTVVDDLDSRGFDCFWAGNAGRLVRITGCWQDSFELTERASNAACVRRGDVWEPVFARFAT